MTAVDLDALAEMLAKATPGPWRSLRSGNAPLANGTLVGKSRIEELPRPYSPVALTKTEHHTALRDEDADYIAALHNAAPAMLAELRRLREVERLVMAWGKARRVDTYAGGPDAVVAQLRAHDAMEALADALAAERGGE